MLQVLRVRHRDVGARSRAVTGASRSPNASRWIRYAICAPTPAYSHPSSTTTQRLVLRTEARIGARPAGAACAGPRSRTTPLQRPASRRLQRHAHHLRPGDDGDVGAFALHVGHADRNDVVALGHLALRPVEHLALEEDHRVVVPDGRLQQALRVVRRRRRHDLQARDVAYHDSSDCECCAASWCAAPPGPRTTSGILNWPPDM